MWENFFFILIVSLCFLLYFVGFVSIINNTRKVGWLFTLVILVMFTLVFVWVLVSLGSLLP